MYRPLNPDSIVPIRLLEYAVPRMSRLIRRFPIATIKRKKISWNMFQTYVYVAELLIARICVHLPKFCITVLGIIHVSTPMYFVSCIILHAKGPGP